MRGEQGDRNRKLNLILNEYELAVERIRDLYGSALTKEKLKQKLDEYFHVETEVVEVITVKSLLTEFLKEKKSMGSVTKATLTKYQMIRDKFVKFLGKQDLPIEALERPVLIKFITFLRNKYELTDNTLQRNYSHFKAFLNWADENGHNVPKDYKKIKIQTRDIDDISLTLQEIETLEQIKLNYRLDFYRDLFLIGIYSGQRYSDYSCFEKADVRDGMIIKRAEKTETHSYIPLHPKLEKLLDKYNWEIRTISSQKFNKAIQEICRLAGFDEEIKKTRYIGSKKVVERFHRWEIVTSHTARRTFITISAENGMPDHIIMSITGIRDPKTLKKYKKINLDSVMSSARRVFDS